MGIFDDAVDTAQDIVNSICEFWKEHPEFLGNGYDISMINM